MFSILFLCSRRISYLITKASKSIKVLELFSRRKKKGAKRIFKEQTLVRWSNENIHADETIPVETVNVVRSELGLDIQRIGYSIPLQFPYRPKENVMNRITEYVQFAVKGSPPSFLYLNPKTAEIFFSTVDFFLRPFEPDKQYDQLYKTETQMGRILFMFSVIAILIASLGLLGLSLFSINKRTKEIGLRKVLGGSVQSILLLLGKELTKWVLIANIIAWPVAWILMNYWLQNFAYKTSIEWWVFLLSGGIALLIAAITVSSQAIKAALANPIDSLRYE